MANLAPEKLQSLQDRYINRTRKHKPEKLEELCNMHLLFQLDLNEDKLESLLGEEEEQKKGGLLPLFSRKKEKPAAPGQFGGPLTDEGVRLTVPLFKYLKKEEHIAFEGVFRKSGNALRMKRLREMLEEQGSKLVIDPEAYLPTDVTGVLKEFLRELPEPLLTERHTDAHKQILSLGKQAFTTEAVARAEKKKLCALQLLMLLMPEPSRVMTLRILKVLHRVASLPVTKMTPDSLATVLSPVFCVDRKVEGVALLQMANEKAPILALMIKHAHEVSQAPKELILDLINYWDTVDEGCDKEEEATENGQKLQKSVSGSTLNTNVCYIDRELSRCDDIASNTQAELESLYAHIHSLPNTPHNMKLKKQIIKSTTTPTSANKKHSRSKSIGASIKKRLPSLTRSKNRREGSRFSTSSSSSVSSNDSKAFGVVVCYRSTDKVAVVHCGHHHHSSSHSLQKKLNFQCNMSTTPAISDLLKSPHAKSSGKFQLRLSRPKHKRRHHSESDSPSLPSACTPPKQECKCEDLEATPVSYKKEQFDQKSHQRVEDEDNVETETTPRPSTSDLLSEILESGSVASSRSYIRMDSPRPLTPKNLLAESEKEITYVPNHGAVQLPVSPEIHHEPRPVARVQPHRFRPHGTPIMRRAVLQIAPCALETSI